MFHKVETCLGCDRIVKFDFVANLPVSLPVKEFWKSVNIWGSYGQEFGVLFFETVYIGWETRESTLTADSYRVMLSRVGRQGSRPGWQFHLHEAQLSQRDSAMRRVSWNLANCHATVQKLFVRQVLNKSKLWSWRVTVGRCVINMCTQPWRDRVASIVL